MLQVMDDECKVWGKTDGRGLVILTDEPVDFHPSNKTANVVHVRVARRCGALRERRDPDDRHVPARAQGAAARPAGQRRRPARRAARRRPRST